MPRVKKEVVKQEADRIANPIPTFREIDDVIFRNIAYFINLNRPQLPHKIQGANSLYQDPDSDLVKFSHVCKKARQASLTHIWHFLAIRSLRDFRGLMKIYNYACLGQLKFEQLYGIHVRCVKVWIKDGTGGISPGNKRRKTSLHLSNPGNVPEITYQDLALVLSNMFRHFLNLNILTFSFVHLPIPKSLAIVIEKNCKSLQELNISNDALMEPFDGSLPGLQGSVKHLRIEGSDNLLDLTGFLFTPLKDNEALFGFCLIGNDKIYSDDQIAAIRIVQLCATGLQYRLETINIPYNEEFFTCSTFWSIWTWLKFNYWSSWGGDKLLRYRGWTGAFMTLGNQLKGMNVYSATLVKVKEIRGEFLSRDWVKLILAKGPLSSLAEYRKMNFDEDEIVKRLKISNLQYIFAKLETDLDLFKTIIKSRDKVGRFAK